MKELRSHFRQNGLKVNADWIDLDFSLHYSPAQLDEEARKDLMAIDAADVFVLYNPMSHQRGGTGGRHVEMGYALARQVPVIVIGEKRENVFQSLNEVTFLEWANHKRMDLLAEALMLVLREQYAELREGSGTV